MARQSEVVLELHRAEVSRTQFSLAMQEFTTNLEKKDWSAAERSHQQCVAHLEDQLDHLAMAHRLRADS